MPPKKSRKLSNPCSQCGKVKSTYGIKNDIRPRWCKPCAAKHENKINMIYWSHRNKVKCEVCSKTAYYSLTPGGNPTRCTKHGKDYFDTRISIKCKGKECKSGKRAYYAEENSNIPIYCIDCKDENKHHFVRRESRLCKGIKNGEKCKKSAIFAPVGYSSPLYCSGCKSDGCIMTNHNTCIKCTSLAHYGDKDSREKKYCFDHKPEEYSNLTAGNPSCIKCMTIASFGDKDGTEKKYCARHRPDDYTDLSSKSFCIKCGTTALYGDKDSKERKYCANHKPTEFSIIKSSEGCSVIGCVDKVYYVETLTGKRYCPTHSKDKIVTTDPSIKCEEKLCNTVGTYGQSGIKPSRCAVHKKETDRFRPTAHCKYDKTCCREFATHGYIISKPLHCLAHSADDELNLVLDRCKICNRLELLDKNGICILHNESLQTERRLHKQTKIKEFIEKETEYKIMIYDKPVETNCSNRRPDIVIFVETHYMVIEIDEFQHKHGNDYASDCENKRMLEIMQSLCYPTIFIRYNPDGYIPVGNQNVSVETNRPRILRKYLDICAKLKPTEKEGNLTVLHLFYDGYDSEKQYIPEPVNLSFVTKKE